MLAVVLLMHSINFELFVILKLADTLAEKIADTFFFSELCPFPELWPLKKYGWK